jgi:hypothetical protein
MIAHPSCAFGLRLWAATFGSDGRIQPAAAAFVCAIVLSVRLSRRREEPGRLRRERWGFCVDDMLLDPDVIGRPMKLHNGSQGEWNNLLHLDASWGFQRGRLLTP